MRQRESRILWEIRRKSGLSSLSVRVKGISDTWWVLSLKNQDAASSRLLEITQARIQFDSGKIANTKPPSYFLMKNLLMSDATLEAAALFLIWLRSLACWAVLCGGKKWEHDVRVKSAVCAEEKSVINILSISRLKCLSGGINSERIPLSECAVLHISLDTSKCEAFPSKLTPTLTKMLSGVRVKRILGDNKSSILFWNLCSVFKKWIVCDYEI